MMVQFSQISICVVQQIKMYIHVPNIYEGLDAYSTCIRVYIAYNTHTYIHMYIFYIYYIYYNNQLDM